MHKPIPEKDWKLFKGLRELALERFCQGVLTDAMTISERGALTAHARYLKLYRLMEDRDKDLANAFNHFSRSTARMCLALMVMHDLLTEAELSVLSEETLNGISYVVRQPYELEWGPETVRQDQ
ncbi:MULTISPECIES: hypothetical protein [Pseudomonas]|uniref:Uncharacterized protein n=1 Tax=Pseudomonas fluorescens TaxID=294 RepID=A0A944DFL4_PSEFL|nr:MULTISPECIES: hypothetical protein [Pseudomonas]MBT2296337.1 hypothetical protein [Pseudomonas fluorescens]MBT2308674.1 hypothetical protein [Pseudomonas fluorescens]MBT2312663.1 hypothetical protein [Pseudomonas fluorescens]MBT2317792.1 hypothetical protein [Pseudomonas fluorescens]MBT2328012.1 hypothetical protein [Pseudomonas fluorescens]